MKIIPIAADSMGTRSCATYIETNDCKILIDPSTALGPSRYGLTPHALEIKRLEEHWKAIKQYAKKAEILIVTHYHYDHHNPNEPEIYKGKTLYLKHPTENINKSQAERSAFFIKQLGNYPKKIIFSDGKQAVFGKTRITFSPAVFHGTNNKLGYVTEVAIKSKNKTFTYTSDVEGPSIKEQASFLIQQKPDVIYIDGPMTYMLGYRYSHDSLKASIKNILAIIKSKPEAIILDHHLLRDLKWKEKMKETFNKDAEILTAAEFAGKETDQLEAKRKELWKQHPGMKAPENVYVTGE